MKHLNYLFVNRKSLLFFVSKATICLLLTGCVQISSLQTAKTLPKDKRIVGFSATAYGSNDFLEDIYAPPAIPFVEVFARQGFANNFDAGLKISSGGNIAVDGKYQFFGTVDSEFAIATGLAFEYQFSRNFETFVSRQTIPIYFSYHPNTDFAVYAVPRFIHQFVSEDNNSLFLGANLGIKKRINNRFSVLGEGSFFGVFDNRFKSSGEFIYQGGVGFVFNL